MKNSKNSKNYEMVMREDGERENNKNIEMVVEEKTKKEKEEEEMVEKEDGDEEMIIFPKLSTHQPDLIHFHFYINKVRKFDVMVNGGR